jgi:hypothetical protein
MCFFTLYTLPVHIILFICLYVIYRSYLSEFFHVVFTCSMPKTLEKYQKCSYAGPETALQNRENEVKVLFQYLIQTSYMQTNK